jgi:para-aminobenzoate synthetase/4-amino-4-deoxychorismate lyase
MKDAAFQRIQATLSQEGSLWLESAFCKEFQAGALLFCSPVEVVTLSSLSGLDLFFGKLEEKLAEGFFLAGWLAYEAGYGFEERLVQAPSSEGLTLPSSPLGLFGVYREPECFSTEQVEQLFAEESSCFARNSVALSDFSFNLSESEYGAKIKTIKEHIAAGNLYQVNFTGRYRFTVTGSPPALFAALRGRQPSSYTAFLNTGGRIIQSFSPELFFRRKGSLIETMPMKGTAPRGRSAEEDSRLREGLSRCQKNLAENLMIVDLLRNDLGRICKPGSVEAGELFATESWPTLHQLVSTIRGEEREGIGLYELFKALYPSGSITGAPKINAMKLIQSLESGPRGIYTGTIGYITPDRDMVFSVAIRTIELSGNHGVYGSGGGIVWDSDPDGEYRECQLKAKILFGIGGGMPCETDERDEYREEQPPQPQAKNLDPVDHVFVRDSDVTDSQKNFGLLESILWNGSYLWLEEHLERLASSAVSLGFSCDKTTAIRILSHLEEELRGFAALNRAHRPGQQPGMPYRGESHQMCSRFKVRLALSFQGTFSVSYEPIAVKRSAVKLRLCLAGHRTDSANQLLFHKTTARELYDRYFILACQKSYDEVFFLNERSEITEGAISTLFIRKGARLFTPPLHSGLLNGIFRGYILSTRPFVSEKTIRLDDLLTADTIFIANSVRGLRTAIFNGEQILVQEL